MLKTALKSLRIDRKAISDQVVRIVMDAIRTGEGATVHDPDKLQWQLDAVRRKKEVCLDTYFAGDITKQEMQSAKEKYEIQIADLEHRMSAPAATDPDETAI